MMDRDTLLTQLANIIQQPSHNLYEQPPYHLNIEGENAYFDRVVTDSSGRSEIVRGTRHDLYFDRVITDFSLAKTFDLYYEHYPGSLAIDYPFDEGYASFFHLFIYLKDGRSTQKLIEGDRRKEITHGVVFEINRHAPIAVYGVGKSEINYEKGAFVSGTGGFIELDFTMLDVLPAGDWQAPLEEATAILDQHGIFVLNQEDFDQALALHPRPEATAAHLFKLWFFAEY